MIATRFNPLGKRLGKPYAYQVKFLTCNGGQYIDLGIKPNTDYSVRLKVKNSSSSNGRKGVFGVYYGSNSRACFFGFEKYSTTRFSVGWDGYSRTVEVEESVFNSLNEITLDKTGVTVNGGKIVSWSAGVINQDEMTLKLCGTGGAWQSSNLVGDFYDASISLNGELVIDLISVVDWDGVACMYDNVSKRFFYNQGTGEFVAGERI